MSNLEVLEAYLQEGSLTDIVKIDRNRWQLTKEFTYHVHTTAGLRIYTVPNGFICDMASIPKCVLPLFGKKPTIMGEAAVLHDFMYDRSEFIDRKYADAIMLEVMRFHKNPPQAWRQNLIYTAVRAFGWTGFRG